MNKIRVIDLLNKIANEEEVPKKIRKKGYDTIYILNERSYSIDNLYQTEHYTNWVNKTNFELNEEVEIIEEDKEIEELKTLGGYTDVMAYITPLVVKVNELVKAVNELKKGK